MRDSRNPQHPNPSWQPPPAVTLLVKFMGQGFVSAFEMKQGGWRGVFLPLCDACPGDLEEARLPITLSPCCSCLALLCFSALIAPELTILQVLVMSLRTRQERMIVWRHEGEKQRGTWKSPSPLPTLPGQGTRQSPRGGSGRGGCLLTGDACKSCFCSHLWFFQVWFWRSG